MGLLTVGKPLNSEETRKVSAYIREHGITQFLNTWRRVKDIHDDELKFGDEIEVGIFAVDPVTKTIKISVRSAEIRQELIERESKYAADSEGCTWHPEFGGWMVESTPSRPYSNYVTDLLRVERNMILRRTRLLTALRENEIAPTVTCFPLMGTNSFIFDEKEFSAPHSQSLYVPDYAINPHPRFAALTTNIRNRRGEKVDIRVPTFQDVNTPPEDREIMMDCMAFGMGMCCLQVTFQARDLDESRYMYDQLAVMAPIMLAITAGTPFFHGKVSDIDVRWTVIAQSVDDRTPAERGLVPPEEIDNHRIPGIAGEGVKRIYKSRYDSISTYIYHCKGDPDCHRTFAIFNDIECPIDEEVKSRLLREGLDTNLAHHLAHLFTRDPLVVFEGNIELDDEKRTEHFENIQSTNWQTCRWKPPPPREHPEDPHIGWRTEFRSMEVQLTDFENAAFTVFIVLITRVVLAFDLAFYIPLSKVDENMRRAHGRDAARKSLFYFRKYLAPDDVEGESCNSCSGSPAKSMKKSTSIQGNMEHLASSEDPSCSSRCKNAEECYEEMTLDQIFNGKSDYFPGLIPLVYAYLDFINCDPITFQRVDMYLNFISRRAKGELITPATWMRNFVEKHPAYKHDSVLPQEVAHDLMVECRNIGEGLVHYPELLGDVRINRVRKEDAYGHVLPGRLDSKQKSELIARLVARANNPKNDNVPRGQSVARKAESEK